jgi:hypothetical protein
MGDWNKDDQDKTNGRNGYNGGGEARMGYTDRNNQRSYTTGTIDGQGNTDSHTVRQNPNGGTGYEHRKTDSNGTTTYLKQRQEDGNGNVTSQGETIVQKMSFVKPQDASGGMSLVAGTKPALLGNMTFPVPRDYKG